MFRIPFKVHIEFPALDRLMNYLEASQQREIDAATERIKAQTQRFNQSQTGLQTAIDKEKHNAS